ncbi:virion core protein, T7 gp14 family [Sphingobium sp. CAP-1]|uniref:virion core protein, T7 gp14 family n=1 Tax=Sphingobium sp. CAP-1 TaxID=2676077 RepID=UPI0012BB32AD|nr:hypothetical protein [Sphingobium sp. CAP-1]QGP79999.1 hypothetical protein GL174_14160 [Sphingobium sp. CAP-1]
MKSRTNRRATAIGRICSRRRVICEPATLALIAAGVAAAGTGYAALAANAQAKGAARQAEANAREASASAADALERGNQDQVRHYREVSARMGAQRAAMAANGLDVSFGSAADLVGDTALYGQEDASTIAENTNRDVRGYLIQGANYTAEAKSQRLAGKTALVNGAFGVANTLLGGATQYSKLKAGSLKAGSGLNSYGVTSPDGIY